MLLVEDDDAIRRLMERLLTRAGYHVTALPDPREAGAVAARAPLAALVTDVVMPHGSGPEVALAVEVHRPNIPTIFMSGYTEDTGCAPKRSAPTSAFWPNRSPRASSWQRSRRSSRGAARPPRSAPCKGR